MLTADFDFDLPEELVAQRPRPRGTSRLMRLPRHGTAEHLEIGALPELLRPRDLLVVNNTRVLAARLFGNLASGGRVEILLVERHQAREWECLVKPGRKARRGTEMIFSDELTAKVIDRAADGRYRLRFSQPPEEHLETLGHVPLPPYIKRAATSEDRERYQTVYASVPGAIAAPTAGLHFDRGLLRDLAVRGVGTAELTLHVGVGTFKPVTAQLVHEHRMDSERFEVSEDCARAIDEARRGGGRVIAVGTTVVRTLESIAARHQGRIVPGVGATDLFITPGFRFQAIDLMLTNFHLPRSTLLMLVCAFAGRKRTLRAYAEAISQEYRFYSYGDAMLIERHTE